MLPRLVTLSLLCAGIIVTSPPSFACFDDHEEEMWDLAPPLPEDGCFQHGDCPTGHVCEATNWDLDYDEPCTDQSDWCEELNQCVAAADIASLDCGGDGDCPSGYLCEIWACVGLEDFACEPGGKCLLAPEPHPDSECAVDADCPAGFGCTEIGAFEVLGFDELPQPPGVATSVFSCLPQACETDSDCGGELVCVIELLGCDVPSPGAGDPCEGDECDNSFPAPPVCTPMTQGQCSPRWMLACGADADCGPGFACVEEEICTGSVIVGTPSAGEAGSETPSQAQVVTSCEAQGTFTCEPLTIECFHTPCPDGLACTVVYEEVQTSLGEETTSERVESFLCLAPDFQAWSQTDPGYDATLAEAAPSSGATLGGCGAGSVPQAGWLLALLALVAIRRRTA